MHLQLTEGVVVPTERHLVVPTAVQVTKAHLVHPRLGAGPQVRDVDRLAQPLNGGPVDQGAEEGGEGGEEAVQPQLVRSQHRCHPRLSTSVVYCVTYM